MSLGTFGPFELEALLGRGGMAEVYRAHAVRGPLAGRTLALKRMLPELRNNPEYVELFTAEADVSRQLRHKAIVEVLEVGVVGDDYYIAMEYVDGRDLRQIVAACAERNIRLPLDFGGYVAHMVAEALDYAHRAVGKNGASLGIVHCDVTPSNVFISNLGEVRLGDFGVAQASGLPIDERTFAGKANYLAPEQIEGGQVSPATDIFGLGAVLYELWTNRKAFAGDDPEEVFPKIWGGEVTPVRTFRPEARPELDALIGRALAVHRASDRVGAFQKLAGALGAHRAVRFDSAREFIEALVPLYDPGIGTPLAIASVVQALFPGFGWRPT